jgi:hypothetical protein
MVAFASPPREPNQWFVPEPALSRSLPHQAAAPWRRIGVPVGVLALCATAIIALAQRPRPTWVDVSGFSRNSQPADAATELARQLGPAPRLHTVRQLMRDAQLYCRPTVGVAADSLLVCLGEAVRRNQTYVRVAFRFVTRRDSVTQIVACPALITRTPRVAPAALRDRAIPALGHTECWRDPSDVAQAEWAYAELPDRTAFTTVAIPDAPRMQIESQASRDTVRVYW